ncbi:unnamed protein product [Penicillium nalgiovense]|uniref:Uncharacterized protein n=1 Tax=Penicillium nalgiovense TaxID=60175 RepID=A0A9W4HR13_PENNA|nr:unnamed protein product [Penicillium nalgiovense]CAG7964356.1 unnamed protein product [Penicillium nalgiovense]CAG7986836.1 unnamed protein product [Penicillium nalgiovense]CAG8094527.1 unnamed protein product [Penicillium nalgiovense]CAG8099558.1 unnamed protein product [Penicillium nalgiovense]
MPPLNDSEQHERMLTALSRRIRELRSIPENRSLAIGRLNAIYRLARICGQFGKDTRFTQLCDTLRRALPGQIGLLKSDINSNVIVADALDRMILESSLSKCSVTVVDKDDDKVDGETDRDIDADSSEIDCSDDNYIARLLLGSKWAQPIVDLPEEPYGEMEVCAAGSSEVEGEMDPSDDDYIARLLLGPGWATPLADFAEERYGAKGVSGK